MGPFSPDDVQPAARRRLHQPAEPDRPAVEGGHDRSRRSLRTRPSAGTCPGVSIPRTCPRSTVSRAAGPALYFRVPIEVSIRGMDFKRNAVSRRFHDVSAGG